MEVDIIMDEDAPLKVTHDVSQTLQRKIEGKSPKERICTNGPPSDCFTGLEDVERAFVHVSNLPKPQLSHLLTARQVDYDQEHDPHEEHKPVHDKIKPRRPLREVMKDAKKRLSALMP